MLHSYLKKKSKFFLITILLLVCSDIISFAQTPQTYWWNDAVFYEVFVRSFKDSDGDGQGDLKGLMDKLDYLNDGDSSTHNDLGVTALWLMPIMQSPSYHGYDVTDYRTIEQDYGTNQNFKDFVDSAHARGIKVIIDYVMNHTSSQHPWFVESSDPLSSKRNWYVWQNPAPSVTGPWGQTVWYPKNGSNYYAIFWSEMPDLNYNTQEVKDEMFDVASFWLQDMKVDGFRLDAALYILENGNVMQNTPETIQFWKDFRAHYKSVKTDAYAIGEAWTSTNIVKDYVNNNGLDNCFEFDLASSIVSASNSGNPSGLKTKIDEVIAAYPYLQFATFLTNHDMNRVMDQLGKSNSKAMLAADLLLTLPGVPYLYYGEEIGMTGSGADENKRTPLQWNGNSKAGFTAGTPWRAVNADYTGKNIASQQIDATSLWNNYRKLIAIRNDQNALRKGSYQAITASSANVISFLRQFQDENIIVVTNAGSSALSNVQLTLSNGGIAQGNYSLVELRGGNQLPLTVDNTGSFNLTINQIAGRSTLIYKLMDPYSTTNNITFQVDMRSMIANGDFVISESVDIAADFNSFGNTITVLNDIDGDGIYEVTIPAFNIGSKVNYKYRIDGVNDGREEFASSAYLREYLVLEGENIVRDVYQKNALTQILNPFQNSISVYPLPANKELFIEFSHGITGTIRYTISDLLGVEINSSTFNSPSGGNQIISTDGLASGTYLLTLENNGMSQNYRIVIQK